MPTSDALSDVIETINLNFEHLNNCAIVSIELCKAFDTLDYEVLIKKRSIHGIRGIAIKLLEIYLKARQQYVSLMNTNSHINNILCGVPWVRFWGHFYLYCTSMISQTYIIHLSLYYYDTNLIFSDKSITDLKTNIQFLTLYKR